MIAIVTCSRTQVNDRVAKLILSVLAAHSLSKYDVPGYIECLPNL